MELSDAVINGLKMLTETSNTHKIINKAFNMITNPEKETIASSEQYALTTVIVLACKHDYDGQQLERLLEKYIPSSDIVARIVSKYLMFRETCTAKNAGYGISMPHVTDANWTLRSDLSSSSYSISAGNLSFSIELESFDYETNEKKPVVRFTCTPEELQLFVNKLKDIELNCDKLTKQ